MNSVPAFLCKDNCTKPLIRTFHPRKFIDWMALAGHNSIVAPTGQEEIQYKIFVEQFGLTDMEVRTWGPWAPKRLCTKNRISEGTSRASLPYYVAHTA